MSTRLQRPATVDGLFVWVLHRFADEFEDHAVVKGGIALRLFDCPRSTTDIDYVFVPYSSKKDIMGPIKEVLGEIEGARLEVTAHSKMIRATLRVDEVAIQVEASVDLECTSTAIPTGAFAESQGQPSRIVRVVAIDQALSSKLAAWNERRLLRDLYDVYYFVARLGAKPDLGALKGRLDRIESRLPALRGRRKMTLDEFRGELIAAAEEVDEPAIRNELAPVLPAEELAGLVPRLRAGIMRAAELLDSAS